MSVRRKKKKTILFIGAFGLLGGVGLLTLGAVYSGPEREPGSPDLSDFESSGGLEGMLLDGSGPTTIEDEEYATLNARALKLSLAREYVRQARWPADSLAFNEARRDPVRADFEIARQTARHPEHPEGPLLSYFVSRASFAPDEDLTIHASLRDGDGRKLAAPGKLRAKLLATRADGGHGAPALQAPMRDTGGPGDTAGDLIYTGDFRLSSALQRELERRPRNLTVIVEAETPVGTIRGISAFNVGVLGLRHTGVIRDRLTSDERGTHLSLEIQFAVQRAGTYHVQGSLYSSRGNTAIAWSQNRTELQAGLQVVTLRFYGKAFCLRGEDGPYILENLAYGNVSLMPGPRSDIFSKQHRTAAYAARVFTCADFGDPVLLERARRIELDALQDADEFRGK